MNTRRIVAALGALGVATGVLFVVAPGVGRSLGVERIVVMLLGVLAGLLTFRAVTARRNAEFASADLPAVESRRIFDRPGDDFTRNVRRAARHPMGRTARTTRDRLRDLAVRVLTTYDDYTEDEARRALDQGTWTDDPYAAAFFTRVTPERSLRRQFRDVFSGTASFDRQVTHVLRELTERTRNA